MDEKYSFKEVGGAGNTASPTLKKGKFKLKGMSMFYLIGGVLIIVLLLMKKKNQSDDSESILIDYPGANAVPNNDVNVQAQLDSFQSIINKDLEALLGLVDKNLNQTLTEVGNLNTQTQTDIGQQSKELVDSINKNMQDQLNDIKNKNQVINKPSSLNSLIGIFANAALANVKVKQPTKTQTVIGNITGNTAKPTISSRPPSSSLGALVSGLASAISKTSKK